MTHPQGLALFARQGALLDFKDLVVVLIFEDVQSARADDEAALIFDINRT